MATSRHETSALRRSDHRHNRLGPGSAGPFGWLGRELWIGLRGAEEFRRDVLDSLADFCPGLCADHISCSSRGEPESNTERRASDHLPRV